MSLSEAGSLVANTPHDTLDFEESDFDVTDNGDGTATVALASAAPLFGSAFQMVDDATESQTSSANYVQKLRLTTTNLSNGTYRIGVRFRWRKELANTDFKARVQLNDSTTLLEQIQGNVNVASDQRNWTSWTAYEVLSGVNNIDLDFAGTGLQSTYIADALIELWRVE